MLINGYTLLFTRNTILLIMNLRLNKDASIAIHTSHATSTSIYQCILCWSTRNIIAMAMNLRLSKANTSTITGHTTSKLPIPVDQAPRAFAPEA
jgi:hypothetical protein